MSIGAGDAKCRGDGDILNLSCPNLACLAQNRCITKFRGGLRGGEYI